VEEKGNKRVDGLRPWNSMWFQRNYLRQKWTNDAKRDFVSNVERKDIMLPFIVRSIIKTKDLGNSMSTLLDEMVIIRKNLRWKLV
jgi:hypothetical protein